MPVPNPHVLDLLKQLKALHHELQLLGIRPGIPDLQKIIEKKPGWTTPAEMAFTKVIIDSLNGQLKVINQTLTKLNDAANLVEPLQKS